MVYKTLLSIALSTYAVFTGFVNSFHLICISFVSVRSLYLTMFQAIGAIGIVYELAPPSLEDLTHLAVSGLVDSSNEV